MDKINSVINIFQNWDEEYKVKAWNACCDKCNNYEDKITKMGDFDSEMDYLTPSELIKLTEKSNFHLNDDFYGYSIYGKLESFSHIEDFSRFNATELAEYLIAYENDDIPTINTVTLYYYFVDEYFFEFKLDLNTINLIMDEYMKMYGYIDFLWVDWDDTFEDITNFIKEFYE